MLKNIASEASAHRPTAAAQKKTRGMTKTIKEFATHKIPSTAISLFFYDLS